MIILDNLQKLNQFPRERPSAFLIRIHSYLMQGAGVAWFTFYDLDYSIYNQFVQGCYDKAVLERIHLSKFLHPPSYSQLYSIVRAEEGRKIFRKWLSKRSKQSAKINDSDESVSEAIEGECVKSNDLDDHVNDHDGMCVAVVGKDVEESNNSGAVEFECVEFENNDNDDDSITVVNMDGNIGLVDHFHVVMDYDFRQLDFDDTLQLIHALHDVEWQFRASALLGLLPVTIMYGTVIYSKDFIYIMIVSSIYLYR